MKTVVKTLGLVALLALHSVAVGCSSSNAEAATGSEQPTAGAGESTGEAKLSAPVELTLTSSASSGTVVITLTVHVLRDVPAAVARIMLPSEIKLLSGQRELTLGALKRGDERQLTLTVEAAVLGPYQIFAGVDCRMTKGIKLHKEAKSIFLGQSPSSPN